MTRGLVAAAGILAAAAAVAGAERIDVGEFSRGRTDHWTAHRFHGQTGYRLAADARGQVLAAECRDSASAYYRAIRVDLRRTPVLHWSWRIEHAYRPLDERRKAGDDYVARVYVVRREGPMRWQMRAVNYVWSSSEPAGSTWPSAYTRRDMMIALRTGAPSTAGDGWHSESRDVRLDFKSAFGLDVDFVDGVALMTDCDDSHGNGRAWYGDIWFSAS